MSWKKLIITLETKDYRVRALQEIEQTYKRTIAKAKRTAYEETITLLDKMQQEAIAEHDTPDIEMLDHLITTFKI